MKFKQCVSVFMGVSEVVSWLVAAMAATGVATLAAIAVTYLAYSHFINN